MFIGVLLIPVIGLKLGSTAYRFVRYFTGSWLALFSVHVLVYVAPTAAGIRPPRRPASQSGSA
jgi:hypothetical protein